MAEPQVDILIVGGGLTGATLSLALADLGYRTLLIDTKPFSSRVHVDFDARSLALSPASVRILQMLHVWPLLESHASAIDKIHVSEQRGFGSTRFSTEEKTALGYVVEMQHINRALHQLLDKSHVIAPAELIGFDKSSHRVTIHTKEGNATLKAHLIVSADGADSCMRKLCGLTPKIKDYAQHAIAANIGLARAHQQEAYERFTLSGPLALLPMTGLRSSLVWAMSPSEAERLMVANEIDFLNELQRAFGYRLGRFVKVGKRVLYPLRQVTIDEQTFGSVVFVGNAAHTLHPVAGQGFNLGLRDVASLAQCIAKEGLGPNMLKSYEQARRVDQAAILRFTDGLISLFTHRMPGLAFLRGTGLLALDNAPVMKNILTRYARGFAGQTPDLVCGIPLVAGGVSELIV